MALEIVGCPVSIMVAILGWISFSLLINSVPFMSGSSISISATSKIVFLTIFMASLPFLTASTKYPSSFRIIESDFLISSQSSITSTLTIWFGIFSSSGSDLSSTWCET